LIQLVDAIRASRQSELVEQSERALVDGVQLSELVDQLLNYLRDLMVLAAGATRAPLLSVAADNRSRLKEQADQWGLHTVLAAFEILAAAKTRMFRSSFARAIAEAALIRISLLDELRPLSELVEALRGGGASPAKSPGRPGSGSAFQAKQVPPPQAPRDEGQTTRYRDGSQPAGSPGKLPSAAGGGTTVDLVPGREKDFWTEVLSRLDDKLRSDAAAASGTAISGPNQLELTFPRSYSFSKQVCERSIASLESAATEVAGRPVRVVCRLALPETGSAEQKPTDKGDSGDEGPAGDAFVEQVKRVFNAG
jgi:DNA polymerase-3 subunit gamma/tau